MNAPAIDLVPSGIRVIDEPVSAGEKSAYVQGMFDSIAPRYDLLNTLLSLGIHRSWRAFAARCAALEPGDSVLDVAAGTGDLGCDLRQRIGLGGSIVSVDFSLPMLRAGDARYRRIGADRAQVDAQRLPFADDTFDAALIAFGLRNVADPQLGLSEMARVVRPGGRVVVLEFSEPRQGWFGALFRAYFKSAVPLLGGLISGSPESYRYLPETVARWKSRAELADMMRASGLHDIRVRDLTLGIACVHVGARPA